MSKQATAGVIARPPLIYLAGLIAGLLASALAPRPILPESLRYAVGILLIVAAVALFAWAVGAMRRAGTSVRTSDPTTALVTGGPFAFSRNPIYISQALFYAGIALAAQSLWAILLLLVVLVVIRRGVIDREERYLEGKFGQGYVQYEARVRRWI
jgi:protein-S-isoprenylcysteine O-methyltransferase Ste14